jgi:hypothetical protein
MPAVLGGRGGVVSAASGFTSHWPYCHHISFVFVTWRLRSIRFCLHWLEFLLFPVVPDGKPLSIQWSTFLSFIKVYFINQIINSLASKSKRDRVRRKIKTAFTRNL